MKVFVWVNYGESSVYAADSYTQLNKLFKEIMELVTNFKMIDEEAIEYANKQVENVSEDEFNLDSVKAYQHAINSVIGELMGCDEFDYGTGFQTLRIY
jgi:hypothetical protein